MRPTFLAGLLLGLVVCFQTGCSSTTPVRDFVAMPVEGFQQRIQHDSELSAAVPRQESKDEDPHELASNETKETDEPGVVSRVRDATVAFLGRFTRK